MSFKPTYLYIKQHLLTGKCYFGKTIRKDPIKYLGSGLHWAHHIKKHGKKHVITLATQYFTDETECKRIALLFSKQQDIINSDRWLNLIDENGLGGGLEKGKPWSEARRKAGNPSQPWGEARRKAGNPSIPKSQEVREKIKAKLIGRVPWNKGISPSILTREKMKMIQLGKKRGPYKVKLP